SPNTSPNTSTAPSPSPSPSPRPSSNPSPNTSSNPNPNTAPNPTPNTTPTPTPTPNRRRRCPAAVARAVFVRDAGQCSYVSPDGRRCSARRWLELDHVDPWAEGGEDTVENLRLRCRAHNQRYARQYFGRALVESAVRHSRRRRAEGPGKS